MKKLYVMMMWVLASVYVNAGSTGKSQIQMKIQSLSQLETDRKNDTDKEKLVIYNSILKDIAQATKRAEARNSLNDNERKIASFAIKVQNSIEQKRIAELEAWYGHDTFDLPEEQFVIWRKESRIKELEKFVSFARRYEKKNKEYSEKIEALEAWYDCKIEELPQRYFKIRNKEKDSKGGGLEWIDLTKEGNAKEREKIRESFSRYVEGPHDILNIRPEHIKEEYELAWCYWLMSPAKNRSWSHGLAFYPQYDFMNKHKNQALHPFVEVAFMAQHMKHAAHHRMSNFDVYGQWLYEVSPEKCLDTCLKLHRINKNIVYRLREKVNRAVDAKDQIVEDTKKSKSLFDTGKVDTGNQLVQDQIKGYALQNIQLVAFLSSKDTSIVERAQNFEEAGLVNDYWKTFKPIIEKRLANVTDKTPKEDIELMKAAMKVMPKGDAK